MINQLNKKKLVSAITISAMVFVAACSDPDDSAGDKDSASKKDDTSYPLTVCVVSGEELGSMGKPVVYDHEGTTVKFCCKSCIKDFKADPGKYLAKLKTD